MSVYIYEPDALEKMGRVEGERWMEHQNGDPEGMCSFNAFKRAYEDSLEWADDHDPETGAREPFSLSVDDNGAIYGNGGWHRYAVLSTGEIIFLVSFCENPTHYRPIVEEAGFTVWGSWRVQKREEWT